MSKTSPPRFSIQTATGLLLILMAGFFLFHSRLNNADFWWHLAAGRWIAQHHRVPQVDMFSFTSAGSDWIDLQWLFEVLIYAVFRLGEIEGIILLQTFLLTLTLLLVIRYAGLPPAGIIGGVIFLLAGHLGFVPRPLLLTFVYLALTLNLLHWHRQRQGREIYLLAPLMILWTNSHGLFVTGLGLIAAFGLGEFLDALRRGQGREKLPYLSRLAAASLLAVAASTINPYGVEGLLFPLELYTRMSGQIPLFRINIIELWPTLEIQGWVPQVFYFKLSLALAILLLLSRGTKMRSAEALMLLLFGFLSLKAVRNISLWAVVAGAISGRNLAAWLGFFSRRWPQTAQRLAPAASTGLFLALLALAAVFAHPRLRSRWTGALEFGTGPSPGSLPQRTADFLAEHQLEERGFNCLEDGGYLIWRLYPNYQVFMDGRLEVHDQHMFGTYLFATRRLEWLKTILDRFHLDYALLSYDYGKLFPLAFDPEWALVCLDEAGLLLLRRTPRHQELIAQFGLDLKSLRLEEVLAWAPSGPEQAFHLQRLADLFRRLGRTDLAKSLYETAVERGGEVSGAQYYLGLWALEHGQREEAKRLLRAALSDSRGHQPEIHARLAELAETEADYAAAVRHLKKALRFKPAHCAWRERLGLAYLKQEQWSGAAEELHRSLQCPDSDVVLARRWGWLAVALAGAEEWDRAANAAEKAKQLNPNWPLPHSLLADIQRRKHEEGLP